MSPAALLLSPVVASHSCTVVTRMSIMLEQKIIAQSPFAPLREKK
jgi:hypothetical protein